MPNKQIQLSNLELQRSQQNKYDNVITYSICERDGKYAWVFSRDGSILKDKIFDSVEEAKAWHTSEYGTRTIKADFTVKVVRNDSITIPRKLFEELLEDAMELIVERRWWKNEPRCNYQRDYEALDARIKQGVHLRDAACP